MESYENGRDEVEEDEKTSDCQGAATTAHTSVWRGATAASRTDVTLPCLASGTTSEFEKMLRKAAAISMETDAIPTR